ncbi:hypothetical protein HYU93_03885 [Candidatus Daviesbacteria bacterium]|nr:hypothetical protein [Candidatus Daviesbacteria bacterium]
MPKTIKCSSLEKGFSHALVLIVVVVVGIFILFNDIKQPNVLGENTQTKKDLTSCSSGNLSTSTNKVFQMTYPNETFLQLVNTGLLQDVSQLKDLTCLQYLDATDKNIKGDIANLKNLTNLEVFSLYSNPEVYGDICVLAGATKLRSLKFAFNPKITGDVACLKNLTKLETFAMTHTQISGDISVFANMPNLKAIYISDTNIKGDICSLSKLTNLEELGIADEYPGNTDITGDLSCLDSLQKLKRVSIYNTNTTNCDEFTKSHPDLAKTKTESGKQGGGGCSKESMKTLVDYAQKYEKKIGKEVQTEVRGKPNYQPGSLSSNRDRSGLIREPNIFQKLVIWAFSLFGKTPPGPSGNSEPIDQREVMDQPPDGRSKQEMESLLKSGGGPGGCKSQSECQAYCSKPEHSEECSKFAPPN